MTLEEKRAKDRERARLYRARGGEAYRIKARAYNQMYRVLNLDKLKQKAKYYRDTHQEEVAARYHTWRLANHEKRKAVDREYAKKNKDRRALWNKKWRELHRDELRHKKQLYWASLSAEQKAISREQKRVWISRTLAMDPDYFKQRAKQWRESYPERARQGERNWIAANPERSKTARRRRVLANPERCRAASRRSYSKHIERSRARSRQYAKTHPLKASEQSARRRAREVGAPRVEKIDRMSLAIRDGWECRYCCSELNSKTYELDHVIPLAKGGSHTSDNLSLSCKACNLSKNDTLLHIWLKRTDRPKKRLIQIVPRGRARKSVAA